MGKITIIEGNSNDKDNVRNYMVKGEPGVSPKAEVTRGENDNFATVTVTDEEGTTSAQLNDGVSPTITSSKTGSVTTLTITDIEGTHTATINDGETANIINSGTLGDNTKETYSGNVIDQKLNNYVSKLDYAVITGTGVTENDTNYPDYKLFTEVIDLPTGFTIDNSAVISAGYVIRQIGSRPANSANEYTFGFSDKWTTSNNGVKQILNVDYDNGLLYSKPNGCIILQFKEDINVDEGDQFTVDYKIVLMKLPSLG